jgi:hypothetical protein
MEQKGRNEETREMRREFAFMGELTDEGLEPHDREEVRQWLLDMEGALHQLGGTLTIGSVREQIAPNVYVTTGMLGSYDSFSPARAREEEEPVKESEPEPEPVES